MTAGLVAAGVAVAVVAGGWSSPTDDSGTPEPAKPTVRNGTLVVADGAYVLVVGRSRSKFEGAAGPGPVRGDVSFTADGDEVVYQNREHRSWLATSPPERLEYSGLRGAFCRSRTVAGRAVAGESLRRSRRRADPVGRLRRALAAGVGEAFDMSWSPDGRRLAVDGVGRVCSSSTSMGHRL